MTLEVAAKDLSKEELNKQIVLMRNVIKRARLHIISSLVHKHRKLKKSADKGLQKASGKADRMLMEISEIKTLKVDDISRFVLMNESTFAKMAKEGTCKDRALARISEHKFVTKVITEFRQKFPKWAIQVPSLYNIWDFQNNVMNKRKRNKINSDKSNAKNSDVRFAADKMSGRDLQNVDDEAEDKPALPVVSKEADSQHVDISDRNKACESKNSTKLSLQKVSETLKFQHSKNEVRKTAGDMVIQVIKLEEESEEELELDGASKLKKAKNNSTSVSDKRKPKSSFFLDMDNNEFSDDGLETEANDIDDDTFISYERSQFNQSRGRHNREPPMNNRRARTDYKITRNPTKTSRSNQRSDLGGRKSKGFEFPKPEKSSNETLHPSWEAKRKQNHSTIQEFKGTKIKFDD